MRFLPDFLSACALVAIIFGPLVYFRIVDKRRAIARARFDRMFSNAQKESGA